MLKVLTLFIGWYVAFFWLAKTGFAEIPADIRLRLGQIGITTVYVAGLLAGLGFFWSSKAKENTLVASQKIAAIRSRIELLIDLQTEQGHKFQERIDQLNHDTNIEHQVIIEAEAFPITLEQLGIVSITLLAVGTFLQLLSLA